MNTALIIIDMQNGFMNEYTKDLISKITKFVSEENFYPIIGTKYINNENTACHIFEGWNDCWKGSDESELVHEVDELCDIVVEKSKYSCWNDTFEQLLKYFSIDKLVFCGVNTGCCVLASAFGAYDDVWDVTVIEDLCASTSGVSSHEAGIQILKECITKERVITVEDYKNK